MIKCQIRNSYWICSTKKKKKKYVSPLCWRAQGDISPSFTIQTNTKHTHTHTHTHTHRQTHTQQDLCGEQMKVSCLHSSWHCAVGPRGRSRQSGTHTTLPRQTHTLAQTHCNVRCIFKCRKTHSVSTERSHEGKNVLQFLVQSGEEIQFHFKCAIIM